jgi:hypothetical protein
MDSTAGKCKRLDRDEGNERMSLPTKVRSLYTPGARCIAFHSLGPSLNPQVRITVTPSSTSDEGRARIARHVKAVS